MSVAHGPLLRWFNKLLEDAQKNYRAGDIFVSPNHIWIYHWISEDFMYSMISSDIPWNLQIFNDIFKYSMISSDITWNMKRYQDIKDIKRYEKMGEELCCSCMHSIILYCTIQYNKIQYNTIQYNALQLFCIVFYCIVLYCIVLYFTDLPP